MKIPKSDITTCIAIIFIFLVLSFLYYSPVLEGRKLITNDTNVWKASAKEVFEHREEFNEEPLWTNSMFGGMPSFQISVNYTGNLIKPVIKFVQIFKIPVSALFLTLAGFFILLLVFEVKPWLAMAGSIAYAFASYNFIILAAGHNTKAYAIAYMAPMIAGIILSFRKNRLAGAAITGLFLTFEIFSNHLQITYYALLILIIYGFSELTYSLKEKRVQDLIKSLGVLIIVTFLAVGSNFASLRTTMEYTKYTTRGGSNLTTVDNDANDGLDKEYATRWSVGIDETLTLLIPNFRGGESSPLDRDSETYSLLRQYNATNLLPYFSRYWGDQPGTAPVYVGSIVVFLFIMGLFLVEGKNKWWLLAATVLSLFLSWGKNFMPLTDLFFDYFPGYNKFRAVSMILVIAGFTIPLLGFLGLKEVFQGEVKRQKFYTALKWSVGISAGLCLFFAVFPGAAGRYISSNDLSLFSQLNLTPDIQSSFEAALISDRMALLRSDAFRSFFFISISAIVLWACYTKKLLLKYALGLLAILFLIDMWPVDKRFLNNEMFRQETSKSEPYQMTACDSKILQDKSLSYRVLNLTVSTFNDASTSNYHKSIGGYHGAKLQRYQELIQYGISPDINRFISAAERAGGASGLSESLSSANSLNMLNTKYIIVDPNGDPVINDKALGNAWLVDSYRLVNNSDEEIGLINSFNPSTEALIDIGYKDILTKSAYPVVDGSIELTSYKANELKYRYNSTDEALALFSEIYYPAGWKSFIDGEEVLHFRANYLLRAMVLPAGAHDILFKFDPDSYRASNRISLISSLILIIFIAVISFVEIRKLKYKSAANDPL